MTPVTVVNVLQSGLAINYHGLICLRLQIYSKDQGINEYLKFKLKNIEINLDRRQPAI